MLDLKGREINFVQHALRHYRGVSSLPDSPVCGFTAVYYPSVRGRLSIGMRVVVAVAAVVVVAVVEVAAVVVVAVVAAAAAAAYFLYNNNKFIVYRFERSTTLYNLIKRKHATQL